MKLSQQKKGDIKNKVQNSRNIMLLPLEFILCILPLITIHYQAQSGLSEYSWHSETDTYHDFFLRYKTWFFIAVSCIMLLMIIFQIKKSTVEERKKTFFLFLPLLVYLFFVVLSSILSLQHEYSFFGSYEAMEPLPVLFGYVIAALYAYLTVKTTQDILQLTKSLVIGAGIMVIFGLFQAAGTDLLLLEGVQHLIVSEQVLTEGGYFTSIFPKGQVYATLFNPNYVGSYVALLFPATFLGIFGKKKLWLRLLYAVVSIALLIILLASQSRTGMVAFSVCLLVFIVFASRYIVKRWYLVVGSLVVIGALFFYIDGKLDNGLTTRLLEMIQVEKKEYDLVGIDTTGNGVKVYYKDTEFTVMMAVSETDFAYVVLEDGQQLPITYAEDKSKATFLLSSQEEMNIETAVFDEKYAFGLRLEGRKYYFTNQVVTGNYKIINELGRVDECIYAKSALAGYETIGSNRGYVWGNSIPLLKKYLFVGSGPDTFVLAFPQNDYVSRYRMTGISAIFTRPHNLYLQMGVQTGVISLLAFLTFYIIYFVDSCRKYFFKRYDTIEERIGLSMFLGTVGFMITGIANDSLIVVSPIFWVMIGTGMAINHKLVSSNKRKQDKTQAEVISNKSKR